MKILILACVLTTQIASIVCPHHSQGKKVAHSGPNQQNADSGNRTPQDPKENDAHLQQQPAYDNVLETRSRIEGPHRVRGAHAHSMSGHTHDPSVGYGNQPSEVERGGSVILRPPPAYKRYYADIVDDTLKRVRFVDEQEKNRFPRPTSVNSYLEHRYSPTNQRMRSSSSSRGSFQEPRVASFYDNVPVQNPSARMMSRGQADVYDVPPRHSSLPHSNFPTSNSRAILEQQNESEGKLRRKKVDQDVKGKAANRRYGFGRDDEADRACMDLCRRMENEAEIDDKKQTPIHRSEASAGQPIPGLVARHRLWDDEVAENQRMVCTQLFLQRRQELEQQTNEARTNEREMGGLPDRQHTAPRLRLHHQQSDDTRRRPVGEREREVQNEQANNNMNTANLHDRAPSEQRMMTSEQQRPRESHANAWSEIDEHMRCLNEIVRNLPEY